MIAEKLSAKGVLSLTRPFPRDIGAKNGTLTVMVAAAEAVEKAMPVFKAMGKTVTHVGDAGAGQVAKAPIRSWSRRRWPPWVNC